jgi:putative isomerase
MKQIKFSFLWFIAIIAVVSCGKSGEKMEVSAFDYDNILNIRYTPTQGVRCPGWFSDAGSWYGFTIPEQEKWVNGFCGPFDLDGYSRKWVSDALVTVAFVKDDHCAYTPVETHYYPGEIRINSSSSFGHIYQKLRYIDKNHAILSVEESSNESLKFFGNVLDMEHTKIDISGCVLKIERRGENAEDIFLTFPENTAIFLTRDGNKIDTSKMTSGEVASANGYVAYSPKGDNYNIMISFGDLAGHNVNPVNIEKMWDASIGRWNGYLSEVLKPDMPYEYHRVAVKSVVTLIGNWKSARGALLHDGVVPSQGVGYFMGFWGWDSWKHAAALSIFAPEIAKNQVRAMFDYQTPEGMIIDCIFTNTRGNNTRDSKPPLAGWAISEIYRHTQDKDFVKEMLPKLIKYHEWWYRYRDHNRNGICEFGSCDGTLEAAAWESGMDNAVRFDSTSMVRNNIDSQYPIVEAWSMNQESVDLNAFLAAEREYIINLSSEVGFNLKFDLPNEAASLTKNDYGARIADYFFLSDPGFFFDRKFDGTYVMDEGTEACIPLWSGIASIKQAAAAHKIFTDTTKFATFIPFPTVAADNPSFTPNGYWRGPIWLDQVYFGIKGLRNYGYTDDADTFTRNVFDRLQGLKEDGAIHENYDTYTGNRLKAPHFSWSAACLLMMYEDYGEKSTES